MSLAVVLSSNSTFVVLLKCGIVTLIFTNSVKYFWNKRIPLFNIHNIHQILIQFWLAVPSNNRVGQEINNVFLQYTFIYIYRSIWGTLCLDVVYIFASVSIWGTLCLDVPHCETGDRELFSNPCWEPNFLRISVITNCGI